MVAPSILDLALASSLRDLRSEKEPGPLAQVFEAFASQAVGSGQFLERVVLSDARFHGEEPALDEVGFGLFQEDPQVIHPLVAGDEGAVRFVADHFGLGGLHLTFSQVGGVADDEVETHAYGQWVEPTAFEEGYPPPQAKRLRVFGGQSEGFRALIHGGDFSVPVFEGQSQGQRPTAGAQIEDTLRRFSQPPDGVVDQLLRLMTRDESAGVDFKREPIELRRADDVLQRLAGGAAFDQRAQGVELGLREWTIQVQIEIEALQPERVRDEDVCIELRVRHPFLGKKGLGARFDFSDGQHGALESELPRIDQFDTQSFKVFGVTGGDRESVIFGSGG